MKLRPLPAEETEGVMYYDPAATGERIQNLRKDREVTQEQLAIDLNISDRYMRNLEKGEKVPSVDLFVELRERFGSSLDYIVLGVSASQREQELQNQLQMLRKELKEMQRRILVMLESGFFAALYDLGRICPDHQQGTADPPDGAVEHPGTHSA